MSNLLKTIILGSIIIILGLSTLTVLNEPTGSEPVGLSVIRPIQLDATITGNSNGDCLTFVSSTAMNFTSCGGGGGSTLHVDGSGFVYPKDGDYHTAPYYIATSSFSTFNGFVSQASSTVTGTLTVTGNINGGSLSGSNSGDVTLAGTPDYITISNQVITRGTIDIGDDTNLVGGTNITLTGDTLNVDDAFLVNDADDTTSGKLTVGGGFVSQASSTVVGDFTATTYYGSAQNMTLAVLGNSTYSTVQDLQNIFHSAGHVAGGVITDNGDGTVAVSAGQGLIRDTNSGVATVYYFDFSASSSVALATDSFLYLGVDYNSGSPEIVVKPTRSWNYKTDYELGAISRNSDTTIHIVANPDAVGDHAMNMVQRLYDTLKIKRDNVSGGLVLSEQGTRGLQYTAGSVWSKLTEFTLSASSSLTWTSYYGSDGGGWTEVTGVTQWDNAQYDNAGTLTAFTANRWGVHWYYLETDGEVVQVYSQAQYTSQAQAESASPPSTVPDRIDLGGVLFAKLVFREGASSGTVFSLWEQDATAGTALSDHGSLSGLSDDDHTQYLLADGSRDVSGVLTFSNGLLSQASTTVVGVLTVTGNITGNNLSGTNSGDVTLAGTPDYLTLSGQQITLGTVDIGDDTNLAGGANLTLTGDSLALDTALTSMASFSHASGGNMTVSNTDTAGHIQFASGQTLNSSSGLDIFFDIAGTINNSGTAGTNFLQLDITTTANGSGAQNAINILNDSSSVFAIDVDGNLTANGITVTSYLDIPSGTDPTVDANGEIAINTTQASTSLRYHDGTAERALYPTRFGGLPFASSTLAYIGGYGNGSAGTTTVHLFTAHTPSTLTDFYCRLDTGTSVAIEIGDGSASTTAECTTTTTLFTPSSNNTYVRGEDVYISIGSQSGNPNIITISPEIRQDAD